MTLTDKDREELTAEFQRAVGAMVQREVCYCVSHLMGVILPGMLEDGDYQEEASNLLFGRTYFVPYDNGGDADEEFESEEDAEAWIAQCVEDGAIRNVEAWQVDERTDEIFEHWIVTRWLKERLREKGQIVEDIHGVDVWARTCTGQAIMLDGVICDIYREFCQP